MEAYLEESQMENNVSEAFENKQAEELQNESLFKKPKRNLKAFSGKNSEIVNNDKDELTSNKNSVVRVIFEGEVASRIQKLESDLKDRLSKPDLGKVIGNEILSWSEKRWAEIVEENTDVEYFFAQIRKYSDRGKSIKLLKSLAEKLKNDTAEAEIHANPEVQPTTTISQ